MGEVDGRGPRKWPLWLILTMTGGVLLGGFLIFPDSEEEKNRLLDMLGTSNRGILLQPTVPMTTLVAKYQGEPWLWSELKPKWRLVLPIVNGCDSACMDMLYLSRQVHVRLDKQAHRLQRILLNLGAPLDEQTLELLGREHVYLKVISADANAFAALLTGTNAGWQSDSAMLFVVDQRSELMMWYTPQHSGEDLLADLKHLLKYSPER